MLSVLLLTLGLAHAETFNACFGAQNPHAVESFPAHVCVQELTIKGAGQVEVKTDMVSGAGIAKMSPVVKGDNSLMKIDFNIEIDAGVSCEPSVIKSIRITFKVDNGVVSHPQVVGVISRYADSCHPSSPREIFYHYYKF